MAELSKITLPNGQPYDLKDAQARLLTGVYPVKGTQNSTTASWTGVLPLESLTDGLTIAYYLPRSGSGDATLNLTLSNNTTTGAIPVYFSGSERVTTQYEAGSMIMMTYWSSGSISVDGTATTGARWISHNPVGILWGEYSSS